MALLLAQGTRCKPAYHQVQQLSHLRASSAGHLINTRLLQACYPTLLCFVERSYNLLRTTKTKERKSARYTSRLPLSTWCLRLRCTCCCGASCCLACPSTTGARARPWPKCAGSGSREVIFCEPQTKKQGNDAIKSTEKRPQERTDCSSSKTTHRRRIKTTHRSVRPRLHCLLLRRLLQCDPQKLGTRNLE